MNNKGFTLVELIGTIVMLSIISSIVFVAVAKQLEQTKHDVYLEQKELYERKAKEWVLLNGRKEDNPFTITLQELVDAKLLSKDKLKNPKTKESFVKKGSCVFVEYIEESKTFTYLFSEECVK